MIKIAITGSIASGKSTVLNFFKSLGAYTVNADKIVEKLLSSDAVLAKQLVELLGEKIVTHNTINREEIAKRVFDCPERLKALEEIIHPYVLEEIKKHEQIAKKRNDRFFVVEIPLLFEIGIEKDFDITLAIVADETCCKNRWKKAKGNLKDYENRKNRQLNQAEKEIRADMTIENNGTLEDLEKEVRKALDTITKK